MGDIFIRKNQPVKVNMSPLLFTIIKGNVHILSQREMFFSPTQTQQDMHT